MLGVVRKNIFYGGKVFLKGEQIDVAEADIEELSKFLESEPEVIEGDGEAAFDETPEAETFVEPTAPEAETKKGKK